MRFTGFLTGVMIVALCNVVCGADKEKEVKVALALAASAKPTVLSYAQGVKAIEKKPDTVLVTFVGVDAEVHPIPGALVAKEPKLGAKSEPRILVSKMLDGKHVGYILDSQASSDDIAKKVEELKREQVKQLSCVNGVCITR